VCVCVCLCLCVCVSACWCLCLCVCALTRERVLVFVAPTGLCARRWPGRLHVVPSGAHVPHDEQQHARRVQRRDVRQRCRYALPPLPRRLLVPHARAAAGALRGGDLQHRLRRELHRVHARVAVCEHCGACARKVCPRGFRGLHCVQQRLPMCGRLQRCGAGGVGVPDG
jgi:hypothetical protein